MYFEYGKKETDYLKKKDKKLGEAIERIGMIERTVTPDLFTATMQSIIGQQISTIAQATICKRLEELLEEVTPHSVANIPKDDLQKIGVSHRKAEYMQAFAQSIVDKNFDIHALHDMEDDEIIKALSAHKGIGVWTAEMLMTFSMQRQNILSYGDLAIVRGMRMLYRHKEISPALFEKYRKRYSPHASVAALYLWAIAGGALPELQDCAIKKK